MPSGGRLRRSRAGGCAGRRSGRRRRRRTCWGGVPSGSERGEAKAKEGDDGRRSDEGRAGADVGRAWYSSCAESSLSGSPPSCESHARGRQKRIIKGKRASGGRAILAAAGCGAVAVEVNLARSAKRPPVNSPPRSRSRPLPLHLRVARSPRRPRGEHSDRRPPPAPRPPSPRVLDAQGGRTRRATRGHAQILPGAVRLHTCQIGAFRPASGRLRDAGGPSHLL